MKTSRWEKFLLKWAIVAGVSLLFIPSPAFIAKVYNITDFMVLLDLFKSKAEEKLTKKRL